MVVLWLVKNIQENLINFHYIKKHGKYYEILIDINVVLKVLSKNS